MILDFLKKRINAFVQKRIPYDDRNIELIYSRSMDRVKKIPVYCPFCNSEMKFRHSNIYFPPYRDDITFKCPKCFHTAHFGIPITKKVYESEYKLRQGNYFMRPTYNRAERSKEIIKERLKDLGYLEF